MSDVSTEEEVVKSTVKSKVLVGHDHLVSTDMSISANYHKRMTNHMIIYGCGLKGAIHTVFLVENI